MRFLFDGARLRQQAAPLTEGRPDDEHAYVEVDGERQTVDTYVTTWRASSGRQSGTMGYYPVSPFVDGVAFADYLESDEFQELAERIIAGTRIEKVDGSTVGYANGDARAAETELMSQLRQLPDHEIWHRTVASWLWEQGEFLEIWPDGTFEEAVDALEPAFWRALPKEGIRILGRWGGFAELSDVGDTLIDETHRLFQCGAELYRCHVAALADFDLISAAQVREWEEKNGFLPDA